ncbi:hypothetical protein HAX54_024411, partial [Datura stramonium]|nr:hypothetical protein [Datura stramonium]
IGCLGNYKIDPEKWGRTESLNDLMVAVMGRHSPDGNLLTPLPMSHSSKPRVLGGFRDVNLKLLSSQ